MYKNILYTNIFGIETKGQLICHWGETCYVRLGERCYEVETTRIKFI